MREFRRADLAEAAFTLPGRYYSDAEIFTREQEQIFAQSWVCAGRSDEISGPGDYKLVELAGESLILVRDRAGAAHAHYNVCRHRGTRMCTEERGNTGNTIQCPYHAWTYGLDGRLLAARLMQEAPGFNKDDYPLYSAALAEWEGFLFVNLARRPEPFELAYAPLIGKFAAWGIAGLGVGGRVVYDVAANWKLIVQNYSECYHCSLIHPALVELSPPDSGRNDLDEGPFLGGYMELSHDSHSMTVGGGTSRPPLPGLSGPDLGRVYYYSLFPNVLLSLHPDYVMAHTLWPLAPGRTRIVCEWLFDRATMASPGFSADDAVQFWDTTNREDWHVSELTQLGVVSRAYTPGPYARQEGLLHAFDRHYLSRLDGGRSR